METGDGIGLRFKEPVALAVWVREDGRWLLLAYQPTVLPEPAS
ncbi:hypothetical protein LCL61_36940 [Amycolatopsis coloradensis]|uniref:Uncharacterized protein n=1 Tax=Amycolatopsis coloradensis TaxID=76021 RepID=A0ACD5BPA7_9PSEU